VWLGQMYDLDAPTALAAVAVQVPEIALGTAVTVTHTRHPITMSSQAQTVQAASGGRLVLGLGVSHRRPIEQRYGIDFDHPARHKREYLTALRPLLRDGIVAFQGQTLTADTTGFPGHVSGSTPPTVLVAALGPAMLRLAGELADGTVTRTCPPTGRCSTGKPSPRRLTLPSSAMNGTWPPNSGSWPTREPPTSSPTPAGSPLQRNTDEPSKPSAPWPRDYRVLVSGPFDTPSSAIQNVGVSDTANDGCVSLPVEIPEDVFERVSTLCLALPEVTVRVDASLVRARSTAHSFDIRRRSFCLLVALEDPAGKAVPLLVLRADPDERDALLSLGHPFYAPRAGRDRIGVRLTDETDWEEIRELVTESYRRLAPKKLR
jgi:hypothetical protein